LGPVFIPKAYRKQGAVMASTNTTGKTGLADMCLPDDILADRHQLTVCFTELLHGLCCHKGRCTGDPLANRVGKADGRQSIR
jgi:hypothetical protein